MYTFQLTITLLGGLAVFIYGMNQMSDGLQKAAGDRMRKILSTLTKNPVVGVLAGMFITAVIQSSSATTVMVIGFVSAGLLNLPQAISIILGANIGTTITAQLIAFKIGDYAWLFVVIGFVLFFFFKKEKFVNIGQSILGFGLLFVGINVMSSVLQPIASSPAFADMIVHVQDIPALGVLVGTLMTVIVQSSSATIAVLQNLASQAGPDGVSSVLGLGGAIPVLFGDNIGTTITALLASIGGSINAKRTAVAHTVFNLSGTLIFIWFIPNIAEFVRIISPKGPEIAIISRQIANSHFLFNFTNTLLFLPFIWLLVIVVTKLVPGKDEVKMPFETVYIDPKIIDKPVFAIHLATRELSRIAEYAAQMVCESRKACLDSDMNAVSEIASLENVVNKLQGETVKYLASILSGSDVTAAQTTQVSGLMHIAADIEHIGDHCTNIAEFARSKMDMKMEFSGDAHSEIDNYFEMISKMLNDTIEALEEGNYKLAKDVLVQENEINKMEDHLRGQHMRRLNEKKCSPELTVIYTDIIHDIEKIGDYCKNIAEAVIKNIHFKGMAPKTEA